MTTAGRALVRAERYIGDLIYGANDGIITTFAIVAGVAGAALSPRVVVVLGVANLLAYLLPAPPERRFALTIALTLLTLFAVGAARTLVTRGRPWRDGLEMLLVGALAAGVAWGVGRFLATAIGHAG